MIINMTRVKLVKYRLSYAILLLAILTLKSESFYSVDSTFYVNSSTRLVVLYSAVVIWAFTLAPGGTPGIQNFDISSSSI